MTEYEEDTEQDKAGLAEITRIYKDITGRMFLHPINLRLYEVVHIYWDRRTKQIAVLRRATDPMIVDPDDRLAYPLKGERGVLRLIDRYEQQAGYEKAASWPTSEHEMLQLQQQCPTLRDHMTAIMASPDKCIVLKKRILYLQRWTDNENNSFIGAVRVRPIDPVESACMDIHPVLLPESLREQAFRFIHDAFGHPGYNRLLASIQLKYWWTGMVKAVKDHCTACQHCRLRTPSHRVVRPPLQHYKGVNRPFQ